MRHVPAWFHARAHVVWLPCGYDDAAAVEGASRRRAPSKRAQNLNRIFKVLGDNDGDPNAEPSAPWWTPASRTSSRRTKGARS